MGNKIIIKLFSLSYNGITIYFKKARINRHRTDMLMLFLNDDCNSIASINIDKYNIRHQFTNNDNFEDNDNNQIFNKTIFLDLIEKESR